jgi:hypothetical protein
MSGAEAGAMSVSTITERGVDVGYIPMSIRTAGEAMSSTAQPAPFFSLAPVPAALAGGWEAFLAVMVLLLLATIHTLYTRRGSGINQRPYANVYTSAPGAQGSSVLSHDESAARRYTRGTR